MGIYIKMGRTWARMMRTHMGPLGPIHGHAHRIMQAHDAAVMWAHITAAMWACIMRVALWAKQPKQAQKGPLQKLQQIGALFSGI